LSEIGDEATGGPACWQAPLTFRPWLRPQPWGNRRLETVLGRSLLPPGRFGESWELSGHAVHVSRVADGPLAGLSLQEIWNRNRSAWTAGWPATNFPWLLKFLDCHDFVSVQVHPDDELARRFCPSERGKSEAWVVLNVDPGAKIYAGLRAGVRRDEVESRVQSGTLVECLHSFVPRVGDCVYLPAGTVHSLGGGVLVAEVQQTSDATLRLFDWSRPGLDGQPRTLHLQEALESIDWSLGPVSPLTPTELPRPAPSTSRAELLIECEFFRWERYTAEAGTWPLPSDRLAVWTVISGAAQLIHEGQLRSFHRGDSVLIPPTDHTLAWSTDAPATFLKVSAAQIRNTG